LLCSQTFCLFSLFSLVVDHTFSGESDGELSTSVSSPDSSQLLDSVGKPEQDSEAPVLPPKPGNLDKKNGKT
jgi:hypothetical protein